MVNVYVGLGSNLDNPRAHVTRAIQELSQLAHCELLLSSKLYSSKPVGPQDQDDFVNAVVLLITELEAHDLLDQLQALEQQHQRVRERHWGPRTLDLDILLFGEQCISSSRLSVPHVEMKNRAFVLAPLAELSPELTMPDGTSLQQLLNKCPIDDLTCLEP